MLGDVKAKQLVNTLPDNLRQAKAEINLHTLGNMMGEGLVDTLAEALQEATTKTRLDRLDHLTVEILIDTVAETVAEHKAEKVGDTSRNVKSAHWSTRWLRI